MEQMKKKLKEIKKRCAAKPGAAGAAEEVKTQTPLALVPQFMMHREWVSWRCALPEEVLQLATFNMAVAIFNATGEVGKESCLTWMPAILQQNKSTKSTKDTPLWTTERYKAYLAAVDQHKLAKFKEEHWRSGPDASDLDLHLLGRGKGWFPKISANYTTVIDTLAGNGDINIKALLSTLAMKREA